MFRGEAQLVEEQGWKPFYTFRNGEYSRRVDVVVENIGRLAIVLYRFVDRGRLQKILKLCEGGNRRIEKNAEDDGVTMVLKEERSQLFRAVVGVTSRDKKNCYR